MWPAGLSLWLQLLLLVNGLDDLDQEHHEDDEPQQGGCVCPVRHDDVAERGNCLQEINIGKVFPELILDGARSRGGQIFEGPPFSEPDAQKREETGSKNEDEAH